MSGHNKWSKIKNKKEVTDAKKSKTFSKIVRLLSVESKKSHGDVNTPGLRAAILKAREVNMPNDNIERAVKKGAGDTGVSLEQITYETYGPGGSAIIIEVLTDNRNKASAEIKHILSKNDLSLAAPGSAAWMFERVGNHFEVKTVAIIRDEDKEKLEKIIEELEDNDEVQEVFHNANMGLSDEDLPH